MKKKIVAVVLVCAIFVGGLAAFADTPGLVWVVPPTLEHNSIEFCGECGFMDEYGRLIDPTTGQLTGQYRGGHGRGSPVVLVYDPWLNLFGEPARYIGYDEAVGMFPFDEAIERFSWILLDALHSVQIVDSTLRTYGEWWDWGDEPWQEWFLTPEAYHGAFAVMYNGEFITEFIFDGGGRSIWWRQDGVIPMRLHGQWGLVDRNGEAATRFHFDRLEVLWTHENRIIASRDGAYAIIDSRGSTVVPFAFESVVKIDDNTIFARYGGRYGILDIAATAAVSVGIPVEEPEEVPPVEFPGMTPPEPPTLIERPLPSMPPEIFVIPRGNIGLRDRISNFLENLGGCA